MPNMRHRTQVDLVVSSKTLSFGEVGLVGRHSGQGLPMATRFFNQSWEEEGHEFSPGLVTFAHAFGSLASSEFT